MNDALRHVIGIHCSTHMLAFLLDTCDREMYGCITPHSTGMNVPLLPSRNAFSVQTLNVQVMFFLYLSFWEALALHAAMVVKRPASQYGLHDLACDQRK